MPTSNGVVITMTSSSGPAFAGPVCGICAKPYSGIHKCAIEDLMERSDYLRDLAMKRFDELCPVETVGSPKVRLEVSPDIRMRSCPCRQENGGSGICGCINGGPQVRC